MTNISIASPTIMLYIQIVQMRPVVAVTPPSTSVTAEIVQIVQTKTALTTERQTNMAKTVEIVLQSTYAVINVLTILQTTLV